MRMIASTWLAAGALCASAQAAELAYTVRPTELKTKPFTDAPTVSLLAVQSAVDVLQRQASWMQVKAERSTGWVKMLSLRFDARGGTAKGGDGSLGLLYNVATTGNSGSTATTGVKGISEEQLLHPQANPAALQQMQALKLSQAEVEQFARAGKLTPQQQDYLPAAGRGNGGKP